MAMVLRSNRQKQAKENDQHHHVKGKQAANIGRKVLGVVTNTIANLPSKSKNGKASKRASKAKSRQCPSPARNTVPDKAEHDEATKHAETDTKGSCDNCSVGVEASDSTLKTTTVKNCVEEPSCVVEDDVEKTTLSSAHSRSKLEEDLYGCTLYQEDIYTYMLSREVESTPEPDFMLKQTSVSLEMRAILVDWLVDVAKDYKLQPETFFLTVKYLDQFLASAVVLRSRLQLVGTAAMFLASKYEEVYPPDVHEFVYISRDIFTTREVLRMEKILLKQLNFDVSCPTIVWFADRLLNFIEVSDNVKYLTMFFCELTSVDIEDFLHFTPSLIAASALCLAFCTAAKGSCWSKECEKVSRYSLQQLSPCVKALHNLHVQSEFSSRQAVRNKYKEEGFGSVAFFFPPRVLCLAQ